MAQPAIRNVHVDVPLTNISVAYLQSQDSFIASKIFPIIPVEKLSNKYYKYTKNDWFRDEAQRRAGGTESAGGGYSLTTDNYSCDTFAFHKDVNDYDRNNADTQINLNRDATELVTQRLLLRAERQWVSDYFGISIWGTDKVGGTDFTLWSNIASGTPITDIRAGIRTIKVNTGMMPNTLVLGYDVFDVLREHPTILDRIKYVSQLTSRNITPDLLASVLGIERVVVADAIYATNKEGATEAYNFTHGKHALLCYVEQNPGPLKPSAGYIFAWNGVSGGLGKTIGIKRFRMEELAAERIEGEIGFDAKVVATDLGYFFSGAVA